MKEDEMGGAYVIGETKKPCINFSRKSWRDMGTEGKKNSVWKRGVD
jgi:hypothetical protein